MSTKIIPHCTSLSVYSTFLNQVHAGREIAFVQATIICTEAIASYSQNFFDRTNFEDPMILS